MSSETAYSAASCATSTRPCSRSACALHPRAGLTAHEPQEAAIKRAMVDGAARRIVLSDATKLDAVAPSAVARLDELDLVISDAAPGWLSSQVKVEKI